jgi:hypothetical protein
MDEEGCMWGIIAVVVIWGLAVLWFLYVIAGDMEKLVNR